MRLVSAFCLTALFAVSTSTHAGDPSNPYYYQPLPAISPIADATFSDIASPPVSDGVIHNSVAPDNVVHNSQATVPYNPAPVTHNHGACPHCGQHHAPMTYYSYQPAEEPGFFSRVMDLERRKNAWLRSLIR